MGNQKWRMMTVLGLALGAAGIGILWGSGRIDFPFAPPPGLLVLAVGALVVALLRVFWAPVIGTALGVFMIIGFFGSGGVDDLTGARGATVSIGLTVQMIGVVIALVSGLMALRKGSKSAAVHT